MEINVRPVSGRKEMKQFVKFRIDLYRDLPYAIPPLYMDELTTLDPKKNPAFEFCEAQCFMAFDGDRRWAHLRDGQPPGEQNADVVATTPRIPAQANGGAAGRSTGGPAVDDPDPDEA